MNWPRPSQRESECLTVLTLPLSERVRTDCRSQRTFVRETSSIELSVNGGPAPSARAAAGDAPLAQGAHGARGNRSDRSPRRVDLGGPYGARN